MAFKGLAMDSSSEKNYARIFVAFPVPFSNAEELKIIHQQNSFLDGIRWTPSQNLHVTIFFLGEVVEANISPIINAISAVTNKAKPFTIQFEKIKLAGKLKRGGMIWAQFYKNDSYFNLSKNIYHGVEPYLIIQPVFKDPIPHVTLARFKGETDSAKINLSFQDTFTLPEINYCELWRTIQTKEGVVYKSLGRFDFEK